MTISKDKLRGLEKKIKGDSKQLEEIAKFTNRFWRFPNAKTEEESIKMCIEYLGGRIKKLYDKDTKVRQVKTKTSPNKKEVKE